MEKICEFCGTSFQSSIVVKKYCRKSCRDQAERLQEHYHNLITASVPLRVVKGDLSKTIRMAERASNFVDLCHVILWPGLQFNDAEKLSFVEKAGKYFKGSYDINGCFRNLIERLAIYKQEALKRPVYLIPEPMDFLHQEFRYGLSSTEQNYREIEKHRETIPGYKLGLSILSEAVLKYFETKNVLDIPLYRNRFIMTGDLDLMQMYFNTVIQVQFLTF